MISQQQIAKLLKERESRTVSDDSNDDNIVEVIALMICAMILVTGLFWDRIWRGLTSNEGTSSVGVAMTTSSNSGTNYAVLHSAISTH